LHRVSVDDDEPIYWLTTFSCLAFFFPFSGEGERCSLDPNASGNGDATGNCGSVGSNVRACELSEEPCPSELEPKLDEFSMELCRDSRLGFQFDGPTSDGPGQGVGANCGTEGEAVGGKGTRVGLTGDTSYV